MNNYEIKEVKITYKMAFENPKYQRNSNIIINKLAAEYNVPFEVIRRVLFGIKRYGNIGTNLRILRMTRNLTQQDAARAIEVNPTTIGHWELNKSFPRKDKLEKIAEFYGVSVEEITEEKS
ncbi:helix-turn-helix domain-containing protein [Cytobacillus firmus]|uniref:helix-turn-helix transcriptional regulator n=1 Tax=Cytobacillus firmus TaxID=1399 RepID=UPI0020794AFB|nr:helix-turn-helix transcriptional regulator [Cytobacillus firmus]USK40182.1 helix-turn-helix domain-containing protein [Cytobacillus firmus]